MHREYRFVLFNLGFWTWLFNPEEFIRVIQQGCMGGFRILRREITFEPRKFFFIFSRPAFGFVFQKTEQLEPDYEWAINTYKTGFFTKTVDTARMQDAINAYSQQGFELYFSMKYPCRLFLIFPREAYFFMFRRRVDGQGQKHNYLVHQTPYNFFTKTIKPEQYQSDLNEWGQSRQLKITYRDERRIFGFFGQPTAVSIWEESIGGKPVTMSPAMASVPNSGGLPMANFNGDNPYGQSLPNAMPNPVPNAPTTDPMASPFAQPTPQQMPAALPPQEDQIRIQCQCGKSLVGKASLRGKQIRCPACSTVLKVE
jgi:hypothetical protein